MSQLTETHNACLSQVHGLYGPGSMLCWYLLILSCMVQWTSQPHRKDKDSISLEMIAILLFPLAAAWHFTSLLLQAYQEAALYTDYCNPATCQRSKAVEAPTGVIYIWLTITTFFYPLTIVYRPSYKRLSALLVAFSACFIATAYYFDHTIGSLPAIWQSNKFFSRTQGFSPFLPMCTQTLSYDFVQIVAYRFASRKRRGPAALEEQIVHQSSPQRSVIDFFSDDTLLGRLMSVRLIAAAFCIISPLTKESWWWWWMSMLYVSPQQWKRVLPETASSWGDTDQLVPLVGGCMVLGWNVYHMKLPWSPQEIHGTKDEHDEKVTPSGDEALY